MKICEESIQKAIDTCLADVKMDDTQKQAILAQCRPSIAVAKPRGTLRRVLAVAAVFTLAFCMSLGVLAAAPELRESLSMLGSNVIRQLQPVNQICDREGIRMEVLAAINDGDMAAVYISMRDMEGKDRVNPTNRMYTTEITGEGFTVGEVMDYNAEEQTTILRLVADGSQKLNNKKITVSTHSILGGERVVDPVDTGYTLEKIRRMTGKAPVQLIGEIPTYTVAGPEMDRYSRILGENRMPVLTPWASPMQVEKVDWAQLNAIGIVDGGLHVQIETTSELGRHNIIQMNLTDGEGNPVEHTQIGLGLVPGKKGELRTEYVLIPKEGTELSDVHLNVGGVFYQEFIPGEWSVTFCLEEASDLRRYECRDDMSGWKINEVGVSPIGITVRGQGQMNAESDSPEIQVDLKDGSSIALNNSSTRLASEGTVVMHSAFERVISLDEIECLRINGCELKEIK